jgi:hypothetical protein
MSKEYTAEELTKKIVRIKELIQENKIKVDDIKDTYLGEELSKNKDCNEMVLAVIKEEEEKLKSKNMESMWMDSPIYFSAVDCINNLKKIGKVMDKLYNVYEKQLIPVIENSVQDIEIAKEEEKIIPRMTEMELKAKIKKAKIIFKKHGAPKGAAPYLILFNKVNEIDRDTLKKAIDETLGTRMYPPKPTPTDAIDESEIIIDKQ